MKSKVIYRHKIIRRGNRRALRCAMLRCLLALLSTHQFTLAAETVAAADKTRSTQEAAPEKFEVRGVVLGPDDKPVAGAQIFLRPLDRSSRVSREAASTQLKTGEDGKFSAQVELAPWPENLAAAARVSPEARVLAHVVIVAPDMAVTGGALTAEEKTFRVAPGATANGVVNDARGKPLPGVRVRLSNVYSENEGRNGFSINEKDGDLFTAMSDAGGRWEIRNLPTEDIALFTLEDERFARASSRVELEKKGATAPPLVATPAAKISGRALYEDGKPAADIDISAYSSGGGEGYGRTKTAADGSYVLTGLAPGTYQLSARQDTRAWISPFVQNVSTQSGATATGPDLVFKRGSMLEGTVIDADTKAPLAGVTVSVWANGSSSSEPSDKQGRYRIRLLPGQAYFNIQTPPEYLQNNDYNNVTIAEGQKTIAPIALKKGLTLSGTAFDEAGKAAAGVTLRTGRSWSSARTVVDEKGNWTIKGARVGERNRGEKEGVIPLTTDGEWQIVAPQEIKPPFDAPLKVTLRRIKLSDLAILVVTPKGEPVTGAAISGNIYLDKERRSSQPLNKTTNKTGHFTLPKLRPEQSVVLKAEKPGYKFLSGGEVTQKDGVFSSTDIIMAPLQSMLSGRVLNNAGQPVAGALVLSPDAVLVPALAETAATDAQGRFTLRGLPEGSLRAVAAKGYEVGASQSKAGGEIAITLGGGAQPAARDVERAFAVIEAWKNGVDDRMREAARQSATALRTADPDRALALTAKPDGSVTDGARLSILQSLARRDAQRALEWGLPQVELIKNPNLQLEAATELGIAIAGINPTLATEILQRAKSLLKANDFSREAAHSYARLAALAGKLQLPEAGKLVDLSLIAAERSFGKENFDDEMSYLARNIAPGGLNLVERVLTESPLRAQLQVLSAAIAAVARTDSALATQLLKRMESIVKKPRNPDEPVEAPASDNRYRPDTGHTYSDAIYSVVRAIADKDAPAALALTRKMKSDSYRLAMSLALAARGHDAATAAPLFREAVAANRNVPASETIARIAAMAYQKDVKLGEELFAQAREKLTQPAPYYHDGHRYESVAGYAFYRAPLDPAQSRLLIEAEWALLTGPQPEKKDAPEDGSDYERARKFSRLALAMAAIDVDRSLEMLSTPSGGRNGEWMRQSAMQGLVKYLMASPEGRATMALEGDED